MLTRLQLLEYSAGLTTLSWYSILHMMMTHTQAVDRHEAMGPKREKGMARDQSTTRTRFITEGCTNRTQTLQLYYGKHIDLCRSFISEALCSGYSAFITHSHPLQVAHPKARLQLYLLCYPLHFSQVLYSSQMLKYFLLLYTSIPHFGSNIFYFQSATFN